MTSPTGSGPRPSGGLQQAVLALSDEVFDAAQRLLKAQHKLIRALMGTEVPAEAEEQEPADGQEVRAEEVAPSADAGDVRDTIAEEADRDEGPAAGAALDEQAVSEPTLAVVPTELNRATTTEPTLAATGEPVGPAATEPTLAATGAVATEPTGPTLAAAGEPTPAAATEPTNDVDTQPTATADTNASDTEPADPADTLAADTPAADTPAADTEPTNDVDTQPASTADTRAFDTEPADSATESTGGVDHTEPPGEVDTDDGPAEEADRAEPSQEADLAGRGAADDRESAAESAG